MPFFLSISIKGVSIKLSFFKSSKKYTKGRELEIHHLIEQGAIPSSKDFWEMLIKLIP